ncbi:MAG: F0F1 ATP synthase subunit delta [Blastocatellia bacterium]|nr:F0F1 ATP synthase subunit delta [Blastocatellia bacterium]
MSITTIANRYAKALADIAIEKGEHREIQEELAEFVRLMQESQELREVFSNPTISQQQQRQVLGAISELAKPKLTTNRFLNVLLDNHRLQNLPEIYQAFSKAVDERLNIVSASITTATALAEAEQQALTEQLKKVTGKEIRAKFQVDPSIIGGVITHIGSQIYDGSIRNQLEMLKTRIGRQ